MTAFASKLSTLSVHRPVRQVYYKYSKPFRIIDFKGFCRFRDSHIKYETRNLYLYMSDDYEDILVDRLQIGNKCKSNFRIIIICQDEKHTKLFINDRTCISGIFDNVLR